MTPSRSLAARHRPLGGRQHRAPHPQPDIVIVVETTRRGGVECAGLLPGSPDDGIGVVKMAAATQRQLRRNHRVQDVGGVGLHIHSPDMEMTTSWSCWWRRRRAARRQPRRHRRCLVGWSGQRLVAGTTPMLDTNKNNKSISIQSHHHGRLQPSSQPGGSSSCDRSPPGRCACRWLSQPDMASMTGQRGRLDSLPQP